MALLLLWASVTHTSPCHLGGGGVFSKTWHYLKEFDAKGDA